MSLVSGLRHVDIAVPNYGAQVDFYEGIWGLRRVADDSGVSFFAAEGSPEQYVVRVRQAAEKRLDLLAFAAQDRDAVDTLASRLASSDVQLLTEPDKLDTPGGGYGFRFFDVDGRVVEISSDVAPRAHRELEPREAIPRKLSHVVINSTDVAATKAFYERALGLKLSDWLENWMCFLRAGTEHHTLAIASGPHASLNHVSFEMRGLDEYMRGTGRLVRHGKEPIFGPGRHAIGDNTFSYFVDPNGNVMEYTTELEVLDDPNWEPRVFPGTPETADQWGTGGQIEEFVPVAINDKDKGLWTPPPL